MRKLVLLIASTAFFVSTACFSAEIQQCKCPHHENLPLYKPSVTQQDILLFASEAAMAAFQYNYSDYRKRLQETSKFFSPGGWTIFLENLKASGNLNEVIDKRLIVKAVPTDAPIILSQNLVEGIYTWQVQIPMLVIYQGSKVHKKEHVVVTMHIRRTNQFVGTGNIAIDGFIAAPRKEIMA